jgi:hypothetical protein
MDLRLLPPSRSLRQMMAGFELGGAKTHGIGESIEWSWRAEPVLSLNIAPPWSARVAPASLTDPDVNWPGVADLAAMDSLTRFPWAPSLQPGNTLRVRSRPPSTRKQFRPPHPVAAWLIANSPQRAALPTEDPRGSRGRPGGPQILA